MSGHHRLLERQLRRIYGRDTVPESLAPLLQVVDEAYRAFDRDRVLLERSMEISSQELLQANADIRAVLDGLVDLYLRIDLTGKILYVRGQPRHPMFLEGADLVGAVLVEVAAKEACEAFRQMVERIQTTAVVDEFSCSLGCGDATRYYDVHFVPAHNRQGSVIIRDITEASRATLREQKLQQRLARSERMESLGLLAGGVAHDLNNILAPLVSYPDLILSELDPASPLHRMVTKMQDSALRGTAIIQDLLTLARRGNYQPEPVNLNDVITRYLESPEYQSLRDAWPQVTLARNLAPDLPEIDGSRHQLAQTVMNLVTNAYEATDPAKGGQVGITTRLVRASDDTEVSAADTLVEGPVVRLTVTDNGSGIPDHDIDHIFEPFYTRKGQGRSGTGLGLSVVYGSVKDCGGTIKVRSQVGEGSRFDLRFPVKAARPAPPAKATAAPAQTTGSRILVVDDIPEQRELAMLLLQSRGYQVHAVSGGRQAVAYLREHEIDLVLLDMIMEEGFDGLDTLEAVQAFKPRQAFLIVSGFAESDRVARALELGALGFVQKPFTLDIIHDAVRKALEPVKA